MNRWRQKNKPFLVGASACLLGESVRYDGGHKQNRLVARVLGKRFVMIPLCPEMIAGLGVPRPPVQLVEVEGGLNALGVNERSIDERSIDVTRQLELCGGNAKQTIETLSGFVVKSRSPSCGYGSTPIHNLRREPIALGSGIFVQWLISHYPLLPIIEERQLENRKAFESFARQTNAYGAWQTLVSRNVSWQELLGFHDQHCRQLKGCGRRLHSLELWLKRVGTKRLSQRLLATYGERFMALHVRSGLCGSARRLERWKWRS
ncbi:DUF523 domain-containing protein [Pseudomonadota bacterium]